MVGAGFVILIVLWTICILICIISTRCEGAVAYIGILCILIAIIITLGLWFHPRGEVREDKFIIYDQTYAGRTALVSVLGIVLFAGVIVFTIFHLFDQRRPCPIKPPSY